MKRAFLLLILLLASLTVHAQDISPCYRLRVPSDQEIMRRATDTALAFESDNRWDYENFANDMSDILFGLHPAPYDVDFDTLLAAYDAVGTGRTQYFIGSRGQWVERLILTWFNENQVDLSQMNQLQFAHIRIDINAVDFDGDGQSEYILDAQKGEITDRRDLGYAAEYVAYLVVKPTEAGFEIIETPLGWEGYGAGSGGTNAGEGGQLQLTLRDLNGDGLPEWAVVEGGETFGGPGSDYINVGNLHILSWRDGELIDLALPEDAQYTFDSATWFEEDLGVWAGAEPRDVTWTFENVDDDNALEILQHQMYLDNWYCASRVTTVIDWDGVTDRYVRGDSSRDYPNESRNCANRQAEEAMWDGDYTLALEHYERAENLTPYLLAPDPNIGQYYIDQTITALQNLATYHVARRALAYRLIGQPERADALFVNPPSLNAESEAIRLFLDTVKSAKSTSALQLCMDAYKLFTEHYPSVILGVSRDMIYPRDAPYNPDKIGCDASTMIEALMTDLPLDASPVARFRENRIAMRDSIQADLNGDGRVEFLIWTEVAMLPFFFAADGNHYALSRPNIDSYGQAEGIHLWTLPDNMGTGLVYWWDQESCIRGLDWAPWQYAYWPNAGCGGGYVICTEGVYTDVRIWRMYDNALAQILGERMCFVDLDRLFMDGTGSRRLDGGESSYEDIETVVSHSIYEWDSDTQTYRREEVSTPQPESEPDWPYAFYSNAISAGDYPVALQMLDDYLARDQIAVDDIERQMYYRLRRTQLLEALERPDEALAAYVAIIEAAPESAWGRLAALYVEVIDE